MKYLQKFTFLTALVFLLSVPECLPEQLIHIVGSGDTIFSLSRFYQVNADELMRVNGITDPSRLLVGRRLVIPVDSSNRQTTQTLVNYRAVRGDTLYSIARRHEITLQRLMEINGFSSSYVLKADDVIKVPGQSVVSVIPNVPGNSTPARPAQNTLHALRWPVTPGTISYMTDQLGVVVESEQFEPVRSLTHGNVVSAGPWRKFGRVVIIETLGGYYYMYGGCETITVRVGDRVTPGMELGKLGINTVSERPQLFFMVFRNDTPMDPALAPRA